VGGVENMDKDLPERASTSRDGQPSVNGTGAGKAAAAPAALEKAPAPAAPATDTKPPSDPRRKRIAAGIGLVVAAGGLAYYLHGRQFEDTDDAQIDASISNVSARVSGTVISVSVLENQAVAPGAVLAELDPTDLQVAVAQAKAAVAQADAQLAAEDPSVSITQNSNAAALSTASSNVESASAGLSAAERDVEQASARLVEAKANDQNAQLERARGEKLFKSDAIPRAELDRLGNAAAAAAAVVEGARQSLEAARARATQQRAQISGIKGRFAEVQKNAPREVETRRAGVMFRQANLDLARAQEHQAELNLSYAKIRAPVAGIVARKAVNLGDHVAPGQELVAIAQISDVWVTADFRETQLRRMRPGQTASVHVDAIDADFSGTVDSLGGATGSRTSVLPPENAAGNYVKVVQRIGVKIRLDAGQAGLDRLRPGMSVEPRVRVSP
jgi:membrane fusion protein (multidrug efflux system)